MRMFSTNYIFYPSTDLLVNASLVYQSVIYIFETSLTNLVRDLYH